MGSIQVQDQIHYPLLDQRFAAVKKSLVKAENKQKVIQSYHQICETLQREADLIAKNGPSMIPDIDFDEIRKNGGNLPSAFADLVRERGCVVLRNVVPESQAVKWETDLKDYIKRHPTVPGYPLDNPLLWNLFWSPPQVQIRSHPLILEAMECVSKLWHVSPDLPVDLGSQVVYPDRFRIRYPSKDLESPLVAHLDSGSIERWECPKYRANFQAIFDGNWDSWDGWNADARLDANSDLYDTSASCSCWRSLQGWLSLSHTATGEGTLRLLPSLKASVAYLMLRPLFLHEEFDDSQPSFPGSIPGMTQFRPTSDFHPHLAMEKSIVGIPPVKPGDYVFWHCDLIHEVDRFHPGTIDSSVVYNACTPLTPYNIESLSSTRESFQKAMLPRDFIKGDYPEKFSQEYEHEDNGAKMENILSQAGMRAMGFEKFDTEEVGLSDGQKQVRSLANQRLGL